MEAEPGQAQLFPGSESTESASVAINSRCRLRQEGQLAAKNSEGISYLLDELRRFAEEPKLQDPVEWYLSSLAFIELFRQGNDTARDLIVKNLESK